MSFNLLLFVLAVTEGDKVITCWQTLYLIAKNQIANDFQWRASI